MNLEPIYRRLPAVLQNAAVSAEGWRIQRRRYCSDFPALQQQVLSRELASPDEVRAVRDRRLAEFVLHAATTVPYYRRLFAQLRLRPEDIRTLDDLQQLPILTKDEVQQNPLDFHSSVGLREPCLQGHTSGSTGGGLQFPVTWAAHREQWAVWWRYRGAHGLKRGEPCLYFGGRSLVPLQRTRPPYWRRNWPGRQLMFSGYHLGPSTAAQYLDEVEKSGYRWIHGYPSLVSQLAYFARQLGRRPNIRWVTIGAESLLPQQAQLIETGLGVAPLQHYGMAEQVANISQCPRGALHVDEDFSAVEFVPQGDGTHRVIGTNFCNRAFPLIRYDVGDIATLSDGTCPCGRPGRLVSQIDGRVEDFIITRRGTMLGRLCHIFFDLINVREAQLRQDRPGEMTVLVVRGDRYTEADERQLYAEIFLRVGNDVTFDVQYVNSIPRTKSGKLRFVVSSIRSGQITGKSLDDSCERDAA